MRKNHTSRIMAGIFMLVYTLYFLYAVANKPRILILHSYATDYIWVRQVSEGIRSALDETPYDVRWHYMDTKRHPEEDFHLRARGTAIRVIEEWEPTVIIAIDDHAQQYVASCYLRNKDNKPLPGGRRSKCPSDKELSYLTRHDPYIVYTGVNASAEDYGYGYNNVANVTGLLQRYPLDLIRSAFLETFSNSCTQPTEGVERSTGTPADDCKLKVLYLRDASTTSRWRQKEISSAPWEPEIQLTVIEVKTLAQWQEKILEAHEDFDVLLFSDYRQLKLSGSDDIADGAAVVDWNYRCSELPMVGLGSSYGEAGEALGFSVAPFEQGEVAGSMALDFIANGAAQKPRVSEGLVVYLRGKLRGGYSTPGLYKAFAHATGTHFQRKGTTEDCIGVKDLPGVNGN